MSRSTSTGPMQWFVCVAPMDFNQNSNCEVQHSPGILQAISEPSIQCSAGLAGRPSTDSLIHSFWKWEDNQKLQSKPAGLGSVSPPPCSQPRGTRVIAETLQLTNCTVPLGSQIAVWPFCASWSVRAKVSIPIMLKLRSSIFLHPTSLSLCVCVCAICTICEVDSYAAIGEAVPFGSESRYLCATVVYVCV